MRRYGNLDDAEDAVQEAMVAALARWPEQGVPHRPDAWLITVASHKLTDQWRSDVASKRREMQVAVRTSADELLAPPADADIGQAGDDTLMLLMLCCHPTLSP